ncbi:hypothetical protein, partial [Anaerobaca lacustris]|nr:hypothetical protein [Sedimentisphaerales bacterium M17dextr]
TSGWESGGTYVASVVSWGGFGKSVLVRQWLEEMQTSVSERAMPQRILWWSFYQNDSVDAFVETALNCLAANTECRQRPYYIDEAFDVLIAVLASYPTILVLDGFEDMQYSQAGDYFGKCKSHQLKNFIRRIGEGECPNCLCVITSRIPIADIAACECESHISLNLEESPLSVVESRLLLRRHGVKGGNEILDEIVRDHGGHPLALVTIATLLSNFFAGDARQAGSMPSIAVPKTIIGDRFKLWRTFSWYDSLLSNAERHILRAVSLFRQIAPWKLLIAFLRQRGDAIETRDRSKDTIETEVRAVAFHLSQLQLLRNDTDSDAYFLHPLWKAFFEYSTDDATAKDHHDILFGILQAAATQQPDTLREMWPLIEAVYHGCKCGRIEDSLTVFRDRIERRAGYLTKNLAAWETKLELCSMFFSDRHLSGRCFLDDAEEEGHLLNAAGFAYMNLGLPVKAVPLFDRAAEVCRLASLEDAEGQVQRNRADAFLRIGCLSDAVDAAEKAVELDQSPKSRQSSLAYLGYAHALMGSFDLAESAFNKAVALSDQDWLPPIRGVQYVETLIMRQQYEQASRKARKMLVWAREQKILFSEAECMRILAIARSEIAIVSKVRSMAQKAIRLIKRAVDLASRAGVHYYIARTSLESARIVLAMAMQGMNPLEESELRRVAKQVSQVLRTSRECSYQLIEAEALLTRAYIHLLVGDLVRADRELGRAIQLADSLKYRWLEGRCSELRHRIP